MPAELQKNLKIKESLALAFGCMIGWGWVVLVGEWLTTSGTFGAIGGFIAAGLVLVVIGALYAELASAMPNAGGAQNYSMRAYGSAMAFVCSWALILGYVSITVFEAVAFPQVIEYLVGDFDSFHLWTVAGQDVYLSFALIGAAGSLAMGILNIRGIKTSAVFQTCVTVIILVAGMLLFFGAFSAGDAENLKPGYVGTIAGSVVAVMVMAPFLMGGFDVIPQVAGEIDLEPKKIGGLIVVAVVLGAVWYCLIILAVSLLFDQQEVAQSTLPAVDAAERAWGAWGSKFLILGGLAGILTSWNGFIVGGSRAMYALANAGMLPAFLGKIHPRYHTPVNAIILITAVGCIAPFYGRQLLVWVANAGSLGFVVAYLCVALSFLKLRTSEPEMARPYKVPMGKPLGIVGLVGTIGMLTLYLPGSSGALAWPYEWIIVLAWFCFGSVAYLLASRRPAFVNS